mgnify:CR=1 FL=1
MHITLQNLLHIQNEIKEKIKEFNIYKFNPKIIAVSKTFKIDHIMHLVDHGHIHYGENKVQEAIEKWTEIRKNNQNLKLHMIGKLQSNKVKQAVKIFDYIHSVDSIKLAKKIKTEQEEVGKNLGIFLQVNLGDEVQKNGVNKSNLNELVNFCKEINLNVLGLMCLPPFEDNSSKYFEELKKLNDLFSFTEISMGMSHDYLEAIKFRTTFLRIGSKIFGKRN